MALTKISLQNVITRETNKLQRQTDAVATTEATIAVFNEQLNLFNESAEAVETARADSRSDKNKK